jgi:hypothetical protein
MDARQHIQRSARNVVLRHWQSPFLILLWRIDEGGQYDIRAAGSGGQGARPPLSACLISNAPEIDRSRSHRVVIRPRSGFQPHAEIAENHPGKGFNWRMIAASSCRLLRYRYIVMTLAGDRSTVRYPFADFGKSPHRLLLILRCEYLTRAASISNRRPSPGIVSRCNHDSSVSHPRTQ